MQSQCNERSETRKQKTSKQTRKANDNSSSRETTVHHTNDVWGKLQADTPTLELYCFTIDIFDVTDESVSIFSSIFGAILSSRIIDTYDIIMCVDYF